MESLKTGSASVTFSVAVGATVPIPNLLFASSKTRSSEPAVTLDEFLNTT